MIVKSMLFVMNPKAGRTTLKDSLVDVIDIFCKNDYAVRTYITQSPDDAERVICEEAANYDVIVCAGGDGTLGNTISGFMKCGLKKPLGYIPCGSTNDYANSLDIPKKALMAADMITKATPFSVDIGSLNKKFFVYVAAFGIFSDTSYATPQNMKNILGHAAYILQGIKSIVNIPTYHMVVDVDGERIEDDFMFGMVSNSVSIGGFKSIVRKGVEFDDGLFEGILIKKLANPADLNRIIHALLTGDVSEKNMIKFQAKNVKISCEDVVSWTVDGEFGGDYHDVEINIHERAVDILVVQEEEE